MRSNTALVTDVAKAAAQATLDGYADGVAAHLSGDWAAHVQFNPIAAQYTAAIGAITTSKIRMLLTDAGSDLAIVVPAILLNSGNVTPGLPIITTEPKSLTVIPGAQAVFKVAAISSTPLTYAWRFNGVPTGGVLATYTIPAATAPFAGLYDVVVTNSVGSVNSTPANLVVSTQTFAQPIFTPPPGIFHVNVTVKIDGSAPATKLQISQTKAFSPSPTANLISAFFTTNLIHTAFNIAATSRLWARAGDGTNWSAWTFGDYQKL